MTGMDLESDVPFEIAPTRAPATFRMAMPPGEVFEHPSWLEAMATARAAVAAGGRAVLLGAPGTGKSLLLQTLHRALREQGAQAHLVSHGELMPDAGPTDPILVDEASALPDPALATLCARPNPLVLAGLDELFDRVAALSPGINSVSLVPLAPMDLARYVAGRLASSGQPAGLFDRPALHALARHSQGLFRSAILLSGSAMFFAQMRGAAQVTDADVDDAASMRASLIAQDQDDPEPAAAPAAVEPPAPLLASSESAAPKSRRLLSPALIGALFGVGLLAGIGVITLGGPEKLPAPDSGTPAAAPPSAPVTQAAPAVTAAPAAPAAPAATAPKTPVVASPAPAPEPQGAAGPGRLVAPVSFAGVIATDAAGPNGPVSVNLHNEAEAGRVVGVLRDSQQGGIGRIDGRLGADGSLELSGKALIDRREYEVSLRGRVEGETLVGEATFERIRTGTRSVARISLPRS